MKIVSAAIIIQHNKVLLARRAPGEDMAGYWEFPGGKQKPEESIEACLEREILEELCVQVVPGSILGESIYHYKNGTIKLVGIFARLLGEDFCLAVHDIVEWVLIDELLSFQLSPADIPLAEKLQANEKLG